MSIVCPESVRSHPPHPPPPDAASLHYNKYLLAHALVNGVVPEFKKHRAYYASTNKQLVIWSSDKHAGWGPDTIDVEK